MNVIRLFIITILLFLGLKSTAQITEQHYRIYSVKLAKEVTLNDIVEDMTNHDVLFYGEEHNDSVTHYLENKVLELLFQTYSSKTVLSMEMFERDVQPVMNEYLTSDIREKNFKKDARAWNNYRDYRPMIEFCKAHQLDVICANAAGRYSNLAGRKGQKALKALPVESKKYFAPVPYDTASGKYYEKLTGLSGHGSATDTVKKVLPVTGMGNFNLVMAQSLWDATMAYSIADYFKSHPSKKVFQVNGRFHSDERFAVVAQLKKYNPKLRTLVISSGSDETFPNIDWKKHEYLGDYIIITDPKVPTTYKE
ncbi:MAG: ChaN family lipoprotein [Bacteroidetes bacterium]|nr:ChaN family lipoprotein [Bacteroidota bacterium]